jgi:hypothetical protein
MKIVEIREKTLPISSPIRNAYIDFSKMTLSLVAVITDVIRDGKPVVGYGFNSNGRYGQGKLMRERFIPRMLEADPARCSTRSGANLDPHKDLGHRCSPTRSRAATASARWRSAPSTWRCGTRSPRSRASRCSSCWPTATATAVNRKVFVYAAGGYYYPGQDHEKLKDEMRSYIDRGYTVVKKKIGGASLDEDLRRIDSILSVLQDGQKLCVDANGRFDLDTAIAYAKALSQYDLFWYEEAGDPLDFELQATLRNYYDNPMATGENLFSMQDARNLIRYGGMRPDRDWLQFDCALSYGLVEYLRTLDMLNQHGWSRPRCIPHGGHQMSLNIAAGLGLGGNESYPDLFQPFGGFPDGVKVENSYVTMPDLPGIGFEGKATCTARCSVGFALAATATLACPGRLPGQAHHPGRPVRGRRPERQDRTRPGRGLAQAAGTDRRRRQRRRSGRHHRGRESCPRRTGRLHPARSPHRHGDRSGPVPQAVVQGAGGLRDAGRDQRSAFGPDRQPRRARPRPSARCASGSAPTGPRSTWPTQDWAPLRTCAA